MVMNNLGYNFAASENPILTGSKYAQQPKPTTTKEPGLYAKHMIPMVGTFNTNTSNLQNINRSGAGGLTGNFTVDRGRGELKVNDREDQSAKVPFLGTSTQVVQSEQDIPKYNKMERSAFRNLNL